MKTRCFPTFPSCCSRQGRALAAMGEGLHLAFLSLLWRSPRLTQAICLLSQQTGNEPPTQGGIPSCQVTEGLTSVAP